MMMAQTHDLMPCPFCGGVALITTAAGSEVFGYRATATVRCSGCFATVSAMDTDDCNGWATASDASTKAGAKWSRRADAVPSDPRVAALVTALGAMVHAVCGETGFAACVRANSGLAYPWPALDEAEAKASAALAAMEPRHD